MGRSLNAGTANTAALNGTNSVVTVTAKDAFAKGDPVFMDYSTGDVLNLNACASTNALAAGAAYVSGLANVTAGGQNYTSTCPLSHSNGDYTIVTSIFNSSATSLLIEATRYNKQGRVLFYRILDYLSTGAAGSPYSLVGTVLPNEIGRAHV